jgi:hypothetical protein
MDKKYNKEKVKHEYETRKRNDGNVSLPSLIIEKENFVHVNNQLNLLSSSSSSSFSPLTPPPVILLDLLIILPILLYLSL